jgi:hypothetical protein
MKTTLEIPDEILRRAKSRAAERGIPLGQFVTEAIGEKLRSTTEVNKRPWMNHMGKLKGLRKETRRIAKIIEDTFERIEPEMWSLDKKV